MFLMNLVFNTTLVFHTTFFSFIFHHILIHISIISLGLNKLHDGKRPSLPTSAIHESSGLPSSAAKRKRLADLGESLEDLTDDTVAEIITTISDPNYMAGPDVSSKIYISVEFRLSRFFIVPIDRKI